MNTVRSQPVRCCICMAGDSTFHGICFQWICTQKSVWHKCSSTGFLSVHSFLSTGFLSCSVDYQTCFCASLLSIVLLRICKVSRMKFLCILHSSSLLTHVYLECLLGSSCRTCSFMDMEHSSIFLQYFVQLYTKVWEHLFCSLSHGFCVLFEPCHLI
jgi:hypothetical protein